MVVGSISRLLSESILIDGQDIVRNNWEVEEENTYIKCKFFQLSIKMIHLAKTYTLYKYFSLPPHNYLIFKKC